MTTPESPTGPENPYEPPATPPPAPARKWPQIGLAWWMGLVSVVALGMGLFVASPGLGILAMIILTPALLRTAFAATRRRTEDRPMTGGEKLGVFGSSLALVLLLGLASCIAFGITCFVGFWGGAAMGPLIATTAPRQEGYDGLFWGFWTGGIGGLLGVAAFFYFFGIRIWKRWGKPR